MRQRGTDTIVISFPKATCGPCPVREQCTTSRARRRQLTVHPRDVHTAQHQARALQDTKPWQATYALRAGVETPSTKPSRSATSATPATAAYAKSTFHRCSARSRSTSSAYTPTGTTTPSTGPPPATSPGSNSPSQRDQELTSRIGFGQGFV
ncbi:MAG: transposase [Pseudonocardiaceae bacterium]